MTRALLAGMMVVAGMMPDDGGDSVAPVPSIVLGMTVYSAKPGTDLACTHHTGVSYNTDDWWVALPIEWVVGGYVDCGDLVYACATDGTCIEAVPVWDTGCMLHWNVWDSVGYGGWPLALDMPLHMAKSLDFHTQTVEFRVWRQETGDWWDGPPPLLAWADNYCDGPLTVHPAAFEGFAGKYQPY